MAMSVFGPAADMPAALTCASRTMPTTRPWADAFTGVRPYARAWFRSGTVTRDGAKMAKSAGNLVLLEDLLTAHPAAVVRLMILDRAWADNWDYQPALLEAAAGRPESLYTAAGRAARGDEQAASRELRRVLAADLDVPAALDHAIDAGGAAARTLSVILGLTG